MNHFSIPNPYFHIFSFVYFVHFVLNLFSSLFPFFFHKHEHDLAPRTSHFKKMLKNHLSGYEYYSLGFRRYP